MEVAPKAPSFLGKSPIFGAAPVGFFRFEALGFVRKICSTPQCCG